MTSAPNPAFRLLSVVVPVYRGADILDGTIAALIAFEKMLPAGDRMEIIAVDDGSDDGSYDKILENQKRHPDKIVAVRLARNYGSTAAELAGVRCARGDCVASIPQDLQEPLELYKRMYEAWLHEGVKINLGMRLSRKEKMLKRLPAAAYHLFFRLLVAPDYPRGGLCGWLIDRQVATEYLRVAEGATDPSAQLFLIGYSRRLHRYHREAPKKKTNWTFRKNIKLTIDNFISLSYLPIRLMSAFGLFISLCSFIFAGYVFVGRLTDWYPIEQPPGWATIIVLLTFLLGLVMVMLGIIGEYLWRILEAARRRPSYLLDEIGMRRVEQGEQDERRAIGEKP